MCRHENNRIEKIQGHHFDFLEVTYSQFFLSSLCNGNCKFAILMKIITPNCRWILAAILVTFTFMKSNGQVVAPDWSVRMQDHSLTFEEIIQEHSQLFPIMPTEQGQGYKQMERFHSLYEA